MSRLALGLVGAAVAVAAVALPGCPAPDPGLEVVKVPASAYLPWDGGHPAARAPDAGREAGAPFLVCIDPPDQAPATDEAADGYDDCPANHDGREFDPTATQRRRDHDQPSCCYRKGHAPGRHRHVIRVDETE